MEEHVVDAQESPRQLFTTAQKMWQWVPHYGLALILLITAAVLACVSTSVVYASPEVFLRVQNSAVSLNAFLTTHGHLFTEEEVQLGYDQPCQLLLNKGCEALFPSVAAKADMTHLIIQSIEGVLAGEGTLDAAMMQQAGPYDVISCQWLPGVTPGMQVTGADRFPTRVLALDVYAKTLPDMMTWSVDVGCHATRRESLTASGAKDPTTNDTSIYWTTLETSAHVHYRYRAAPFSSRLVQPHHPKNTVSAVTGESSHPVAYDGLPRFTGLKIVSIVPVVLATVVFGVCTARAVMQYRAGRQALAVLQALAEAQPERVVGHVRAPPGAQVPRARTRGVFQADVDVKEVHDDGGSGTGAETVEDVDFPYGRAAYRRTESQSAEEQEEPDTVTREADSLKPAPEAVSATGNEAVAVDMTEVPSSVGVPLASSAPSTHTAWGARPRRTVTSAPTDHVGSAMMHNHAQYQLAMSIQLRTAIMESLVGTFLLLLVAIFHVTGTLEHWRVLIGTSTTAAAATVVPHPMASAACMNFASVVLACVAAAVMSFIYARDFSM